MNDVLGVVYLLCFAAIGGGAFALMTQSLRRTEARSPVASQRKRGDRHPEAPQPGDSLLYVDFSRERLEKLFQESP
ncbi:MAG: hypothetical protein K9J72_08275 [Synechococcus sp. Tobar2m-G35]|nr:hypothetical protein [Synechococcus sp. Tobar2m-G35]